MLCRQCGCLLDEQGGEAHTRRAVVRDGRRLALMMMGLLERIECRKESVALGVYVVSGKPNKGDRWA